MIENLKSKFYTKLVDKGYHISDRPNFEEKYPWLILRLSNLTKMKFLKVRYTVADIKIDVFSTYSGEKEILSIEEEATAIAEEIAAEVPEIMGVALKSCRIIDDKEKGPVMKHGILVYQFVLTAEENANEDE